MLASYRECLGRVLHLEQRIKELGQALDDYRKHAVEDAAGIGSQNMDGMPRGTKVGQPTERIAIALADGWVPDEIRSMENELRKAQSEYNEKATVVVFVDAWLHGLTERERWIVERQVIDNCTWREVTTMFLRDFGESRTKDGLKYIKDRALQKIYRMAE